jgi:hypothetical protein
MVIAEILDADNGIPDFTPVMSDVFAGKPDVPLISMRCRRSKDGRQQ